MLRCWIPLLSALGCLAHDYTATVSATGAQAIPTTLWGQTFQDISSGDGGLYAELLQNRAFQKVTPNTPEALAFWQPINGADISVIADPVPVSGALPNSLKLTVPSGKFGPVGFGNEGYFGFKVDTTLTYKASFFYRFPVTSTFTGNAVLGFQTSTGLSLGSVSAPLKGTQTSWLQVNVTFKPVQAPFNNNNYFAITLDGSAAVGQTVHFAMMSLFPPTFKARANGVRLDLANALVEMTPGFLRFAGGANMGSNFDNRWQWNATVGRLADRPGRIGSSGYLNTDGLGLYEFLQFCEDLPAKPIMSIWSGLSLDGKSVEEADMGPIIQQAIDQINFAIGATTTAPGKIRAAMGHAAAFTALTFIEVGSEDFMASESYAYRWRILTSVLSQNFPQLRFIATSNSNNPTIAPDPTHWDIHSYKTPGWFAHNSFFYDGFTRNGTMYLEGEYSAFSTDETDNPATPGGNGRLQYPTMESSTGEAAFMTGIERNSDIVFGAAYSPLFNNILSTQTSPNLISFDIAAVYRSTSFYVQKMFATNRGTTYFPSTLPDPNGSLFWSVTRNTPTNQYFFKVVNTLGDPQNITFVLPLAVRTGTSLVLNGTATSSNTPAAPSLVVPITKTITLTVANKLFNYTAPPFSVSVVKMA